MVGATVLGGGTPTFDAGRVHPLRLLSTRGRDGSGILLLHYEVVGRDDDPGTRHVLAVPGFEQNDPSQDLAIARILVARDDDVVDNHTAGPGFD